VLARSDPEGDNQGAMFMVSSDHSASSWRVQLTTSV